MSFSKGQTIIYMQQNPHCTMQYIEVEATYIEPRGKKSALIQIGYGTKIVRAENLKEATC